MSDNLQDMFRVAPPSALVFRDDNGEPTVEGLVVPYDKWSEVDSVIEGHFLERFAAGSLKKTFAEGMRRAKGYFEHGRSRMFDRTPIMDVQETWETPAGPFFRAVLLRGLPEWMMDGLRRGLYGVSLGAEPVKVERVRKPKPSEHNPAGLEERTYREVRAFDISLTPTPHYQEAAAVLRSITDELAVEKLVAQPERLLQLLREVQEAEPAHSEPEEPEPETEPETAEDPPEQEPEAEPEPDGSRVTQPPTEPVREIPDFLADSPEEDWRL